jgi:hypothetical protein
MYVRTNRSGALFMLLALVPVMGFVALGMNGVPPFEWVFENLQPKLGFMIFYLASLLLLLVFRLLWESWKEKENKARLNALIEQAKANGGVTTFKGIVVRIAEPGELDRE